MFIQFPLTVYRQVVMTSFVYSFSAFKSVLIELIKLIKSHIMPLLIIKEELAAVAL